MEPKTEFSLDFTLAAALPKTLPQLISLRYGLVVRIAGSHPAGPGSIPGTGTPFCTFSGLFVMALSCICPSAAIFLSKSLLKRALSHQEFKNTT